MQTVTFYTHLGDKQCSEAYQMLLEVAYDSTLEIDVVDVTHAHNQHLKAIYGERIPVIARTDSETELDWPFTEADIRSYLL